MNQNNKMHIYTPTTQFMYQNLYFYIHLKSSACLLKLLVIWQHLHITNLISSYFFQAFYSSQTYLTEALHELKCPRKHLLFLVQKKQRIEEILFA